MYLRQSEQFQFWMVATFSYDMLAMTPNSYAIFASYEKMVAMSVTTIMSLMVIIYKDYGDPLIKVVWEVKLMIVQCVAKQ